MSPTSSRNRVPLRAASTRPILRVVAPVNVRGGQLTAYDPAAGRVREFAIHRVTSVVAPE